MLLHLFTLAAAWKCAPEDVQNCLIQFETEFQAACAPDDYACQCDNVLEKGTKCFEDCPDAALDDFIATYADGVCRKAAEVQLDVEVTISEHHAGRPHRANETSHATTTKETETTSESLVSASISSNSSSSSAATTSAQSSVSSSVSSSASSSSFATTSEMASGTKASLEMAMELLGNSSFNMSIDEHERNNHDVSPFSKLKWSMFAAVPIALVLIII